MKTIVVFLLVLAVPAMIIGQQSSNKTHLAEVRFHDGSIVRMTILQESIDVQTKYVKLNIPLSDVRHVEFGLHVPPETAQKVAQSIKRLASDFHKERDTATRDLVQLGRFALWPLLKASKSGDQEVAYRAIGALKQIEERVSPDLLKLQEEDVVYTVEFVMIGKICSPTIKAHSPYFGEVVLKLSELRTMHVKHQSGNLHLVLDATKHGSALDQWCDTGMMVDTGQRLVITSEGQVDLWPQGAGQYMASPKGYNTTGKGGQFMAGALIGKIGENGKTFFIGEQYNSNVNEEGKLYLLIVPNPWNSGSTGKYKARIVTDYSGR